MRCNIAHPYSECFERVQVTQCKVSVPISPDIGTLTFSRLYADSIIDYILAI
jgi:hypothetical protein